MTMSASWRRLSYFRKALSEIRVERESTTEGRRDKRGTPHEPQVIEMTWVPACRSVGPRAATNELPYDFNADCGTGAKFRYEEEAR
jgi:hypothetical protein